MTDPYADIRQRLAEATPGEWHVRDVDDDIDDERIVQREPDTRSPRVTPVCVLRILDVGIDMSAGNADLIAHAPTDLTRLLDDNDRLRALLSEARGTFCGSDLVQYEPLLSRIDAALGEMK